MLKIGSTFLLVSFSWIFFRAASIPQAFQIIGNIFKAGTSIPASFSIIELSLLVVAFCMMTYIEWCNTQKPLGKYLSSKPLLVRWTFYVGLALIVMNFSMPLKIPFIYGGF